MAKIKFEATIERLFDHSATVKSFFVKPVGQVVPDFKPGQFMVVFYQLQDRLVKRAYSIASAPGEKDHLELCIKLVEGGRLTPRLFALERGASLTLMGPLGHFLLPDPLPPNLALVATGTGVAPFRSMLVDLLSKDHTGQLQLFFGVRYESEILYHDLFQRLARHHPNFHYYPTISRPRNWQGARGYVQELLAKELKSPPDTQVLICGMDPMIQAVRATSLQLGVSAESIHFEKYG